MSALEKHLASLMEKSDSSNLTLVADNAKGTSMTDPRHASMRFNTSMNSYNSLLASPTLGSPCGRGSFGRKKSSITQKHAVFPSPSSRRGESRWQSEQKSVTEKMSPTCPMRSPDGGYGRVKLSTHELLMSLPYNESSRKNSSRRSQIQGSPINTTSLRDSLTALDNWDW